VDCQPLSSGRSLADAASISLLQERFTHQDELTDQLQAALHNCRPRAGKGVLAEQTKVDMDGAFDLLPGYARSHRRRLGEIAVDVISGAATLPTLRSPPTAKT
jgi:AmiR/NasT family two-component response regulator